MNTPEISYLPPVDLLPAPVVPLLEARDLAFEKYDDFAVAHADVLRSDWAEHAEALDTVAAAEAVTAGRDVLKMKSRLAEARDLRPRLVGAAQALAAEVRRTDRALVDAFRKHVGEMAPGAAQALQESASAYEEAHRALLAAREAFGRAAYLRRYVYDWSGTGFPDFADSSAPALASGLAPNAPYGLGEIREVLDSFRAAGLSDDATGDAPADRLVRISFGDGQTMELSYSQAAALVGSSNAPGVSFVDPADAPARASD